MTIGSGSVSGVIRRTPFATSAPDDGERRNAGNADTMVGGEAATSNGRSRCAPQRTLAQRARSINSADGPMEEHLATSTNLSTGTAGSGAPSATTHPPTRLPCNGTRTNEPTATRARSGSGTR